MIGAKARTQQRRSTIDRMLAGGYGDGTILAAFETGDLRALLSADEGNAARTIRRDISWCQAQRAVNPAATSARDHLADLREQIQLAEAYLKEAKGSERRLQLSQIAAFRRDLADAEGRGLMPYKPGPKTRAPEDRNAGQARNKAGRVAGLQREAPTPTARAGKYAVDPARPTWGTWPLDPFAEAPWRREDRGATAEEATALDAADETRAADPERYYSDSSWARAGKAPAYELVPAGAMSDNFHGQHAVGCGCDDEDVNFAPCPKYVTGTGPCDCELCSVKGWPPDFRKYPGSDDAPPAEPDDPATTPEAQPEPTEPKPSTPKGDRLAARRDSGSGAVPEKYR